MVTVLDEVQIFDQEIVAARPSAEQFPNFFKRCIVKLAPFGECSRPLARANMPCRPIWHAALRGTLLQL
jgi:hypothetical protein